MICVRLTILIVLINISSSCETLSDSEQCCSQEEMNSLFNIFDTAGGISWTKSEGWDSKNEDPASRTKQCCCLWYGVNCHCVNEQWHVTELVLDNNQLTGKLESLSGVPQLRLLDVRHNELNDDIEELGLNKLTSLEALAISNNKMVGKISNVFGSRSVLSEKLHTAFLFPNSGLFCPVTHRIIHQLNNDANKNNCVWRDPNVVWLVYLLVPIATFPILLGIFLIRRGWSPQMAIHDAAYKAKEAAKLIDRADPQA